MNLQQVGEVVGIFPAFNMENFFDKEYNQHLVYHVHKGNDFSKRLENMVQAKQQNTHLNSNTSRKNRHSNHT